MAFSPLQTHVALQDGEDARSVTARLEYWLEAERERIGLWIPVALGLGIGAWFALPTPGWWAGWMVLCAGFAGATLLLPTGGRLQRALLVAALMAAAGCLLVWGKALGWGERPITRPATVELRGKVRAIQPVVAQGMTRLLLVPHPVRADLPGLIRVNVDDADLPYGVAIGAVLSLRTRLMPPAPPAVPGGYDFAQKAYFAGIGATGRALPPIAIVEPAVQPLMPMRQRLAEHIRSRLANGEGAIAATLATGDVGAITAADAEAMRRSGLAHLLSISGLHVSALIAAAIWIIARILALSRRVALGLPVLAIAAAGGATAGIGYTMLTGAEVPTVRSCIAALLVLGGLALGREALSLRLIAVGAIVVLLFWPEALVGPSFQMSFMAVIVLVSLSEAAWFRRLTHARDEPVVKKMGRALLATFIYGLAIEAALMPIALYHFHQAGVLGALANLVAIPLTTFVVMPVEALALVLDIVGLGAPAWWVVGKALALLLWVAHVVAAQSVAVLTLPLFAQWPWVAAVLGSLWLLLWRTRVRMLGLVPALAGTLAMAFSPAPDILVTGDGAHMAVRAPDGTMALLRGGAGEYVRDVLGSVAGAGTGGEGMKAIADLPNARCSIDLCAVDVMRGGQNWRIVATRTRDWLLWRDMIRECAAADIFVSDRRLPEGCKPRWLKLDRRALATSGGVAVYLAERKTVSVRQPGDRHPWVVPASILPPRPYRSGGPDAQLYRRNIPASLP